MTSEPFAPKLGEFPVDGNPQDAATQSTRCGVDRQSRERGLQSRACWPVEAVAHIVLGYLLVLLGQQLILPLLAVHVGLTTHFGIATLFTLQSLVRSYLLRRLFNHMAWRRQRRKRLLNGGSS